MNFLFLLPLGTYALGAYGRMSNALECAQLAGPNERVTFDPSCLLEGGLGCIPSGSEAGKDTFTPCRYCEFGDYADIPCGMGQQLLGQDPIIECFEKASEHEKVTFDPTCLADGGHGCIEEDGIFSGCRYCEFDQFAQIPCHTAAPFFRKQVAGALLRQRMIEDEDVDEERPLLRKAKQTLLRKRIMDDEGMDEDKPLLRKRIAGAYLRKRIMEDEPLFRKAKQTLLRKRIMSGLTAGGTQHEHGRRLTGWDGYGGYGGYGYGGYRRGGYRRGGYGWGGYRRGGYGRRRRRGFGRRGYGW